MNKMEILLEQLQLENTTQLKETAVIEKVEIEHDAFTFHIRLESLLDYHEFIELQSHLDRFPYPCDFLFSLNKLFYREDDIANYFLYFCKHHAQDYPQLGCVEPSQIQLDRDLLRIELVNEIQLNSIEPLKPKLNEFFHTLGIDLFIDFYVNKENPDYQRMLAEMETQRTQEVYIKPTPIAPTKKENKYVPYNSKKFNDVIALKLNEINGDLPNVSVQGYVFKVELTKIRSGKHIQSIWLTDYTDSIMCKRFENARQDLDALNEVKKGVWIKVIGEVKFDSFARETVMMANQLEIIPAPLARTDKAEKKRVELHMHSKMSTMDGIANVSDYIDQAAKWGHPAIAITDHGNVQSFPEAQQAASKAGIKMLYGCEVNMIDPTLHIVRNVAKVPLRDAVYVSFDLETTGLSVIHDGITEFGAVKIRNGEVIDRLQSFINPEKEISAKITQLTSITNEMVKDAPTIKEFLPTIKAFFGDDIIVAHNATFDVGFLNEACKRHNMELIHNPYIDSLPLARAIMKPMKSYRLGTVARHYKVGYDEEVAHRADYDAEVLGSVFNLLISDAMDKKKITYLDELNSLQTMNTYQLVFPYHATLLVKNKIGLKNLFKIISKSCTEFYYGDARIPKEVLEEYREGLLIGSSCYRSDVFEAALNLGDSELEEYMKFYDYIEIQPFADYYHLIDRGNLQSEEDLIISLKRLIKMAKKLNKLIVATGDVHFLNPTDKIYRDVFIANPTIGINRRAHPLCNRKDPRAFTPSQYFRTTDEMMECYPYLDHNETYEYVVENTNKIADMIDGDFSVVHDQLFTPGIEGVDELLTELCYKNAHKMYGDPLPEIIEARLERELGNIIKHGFAVIYYIAHKLVKKSNDDGYLVGSRGSVGSSFVATMAEITEVNPLAPHYYCPHCQYSEFVEEEGIADGYDLPDKLCPKCGKPLKGDGHNIPFETFLGFNADKVPDIDLNFSGDYQWKAHNYTQVLFGEDKVYRAGTISTVADKTAYGYAKGYAELLGIDNSIRSAELERIAMGCTGVKRTSGQHPGGIIVIPGYMDVYDFTPIQFPADDVNASWKTTHFDFHAIHDNVLKLDILGHVDPTVTRMLQDLTGIDPKDIPTNDEKVMSLFTSTKAMGIDLSYLNCKTGALGLPEFGTQFVRGMLEQTQPKSFNDLLIISGLSHGTDVYLGNAESLIKSGTCTLSEVIGCRDDIMVYLIEKGLPNKDAFDIMECVRKGKSPKVFPEKDYENLMKKYNVPEWYIESCKKIKYMFPKAHAAAYVLSAIRVAWWKLYYPREYYAVYFTTRCDAYDIETMIKGKEAILLRKQEIEKSKQEYNSTKKDEDLLGMFEIALEMYERGFHFNNVSLDKSDATDFILDPDDDKALIPPFTAIDGLGEAVGISVIEARKVNPFLSKEDVIKRTRLNNTHIKFMSKLNVFAGMEEENQLSLF